MKYKYMISDMDGVLLNTEVLLMKICINFAKELGFILTEQTFIDTIGLDSKDTKDVLIKHITRNYDKFHELKYEKMFAHLKEFGTPVKDGVIKGLTTMKKCSMKLALATSTSQDKAKIKLHNTSISQYFDAFTFGNEVKLGKPAPDIFLLAAERLGVSPSKCVVLEDSPPGILAAKAAGMHAILIPDLKAPDKIMKQTADYIADDFLSAINYILS